FDAFSDDLLPAALVFFWREADHFAKPALYRLALAQVDEEVRVVAVEGFEMGRDRPPQLFRGAPVGPGDLADRAEHLRDGFLDDEVEQFLLAVEMMVKAALQDADLVGDVADGGGVIALVPKHLRRCRNYVV